MWARPSSGRRSSDELGYQGTHVLGVTEVWHMAGGQHRQLRVRDQQGVGDLHRANRVAVSPHQQHRTRWGRTRAYHNARPTGGVAHEGGRLKLEPIQDVVDEVDGGLADARAWGRRRVAQPEARPGSERPRRSGHRPWPPGNRIRCDADGITTDTIMAWR